MVLLTQEVHFAWLNTKNNGGIEGVTYPILADTNRNLSNILGYLISNPLNTAKKLISNGGRIKRNL
jgi:alkyl hydroperoxide reductase subunit AhpC